jgi:hypothetical protein
MEMTEKNTKAEILKAYETLLQDVQTAKADVPKKMQEEKQRNETLEKVSNVSNEGIVKGINTLKTSLNNSLDEVLKNLTEEFKKLEEIRAAIKLEKQSLEELYSLSANTDSLAAMLLAQKAQKENFEKEKKGKEEAFAEEMALKKEQWEIEKNRKKAEEKEFTDEQAKRRKREEDEYAYNLKIRRQKEQDEYDSKKLHLDKELTDKKLQFEKDMTDKKLQFEQEVSSRELNLKNAEAELAELRKNNAEFPAKLEKALKDKETDVTKLLQTKFGFDIQLKDKQYEGDIRLKDQMIASLQEKIKEQQAQFKENTDKANRAEANVKDIAVKAIENASKVRMITPIKPDKEES